MLAHDAGIAIDAAVRARLALNEARYPVEKALGNARRHDQLRPSALRVELGPVISSMRGAII